MIADAANELVDQGFLLEEDAERYVSAAERGVRELDQ